MKLARTLFKTPNSTQAELNFKLIVYEKNRSAFQIMIDCLDINKAEDFTLDFKLFKKQMACVTQNSTT